MRQTSSDGWHESDAEDHARVRKTRFTSAARVIGHELVSHAVVEGLDRTDANLS